MVNATDGAWGAVLHIVTEPGRAFAVVAQQRPILAPLLVVALISAAGAALVGHLYTVESMELARSSRFMKRLAEANPQVNDQIEAELEAARHPSAGGRALGVLQSLAGVGLMVMIYALLLLAATKLGGSEMTFRALVSLVLYTSIIVFGLGTVVRTPLILSKGEALSVTTSLAMLLPDEPVTSDRFRLLSLTDFFTVWGTIVTALGLVVVGKLGRGYALSVCVALFLLFAAVQYLFSGFLL